MTGDYNLMFLIIMLIALTWLTVSKVPACGLLVFALAIFVWNYIYNNPLPNITSVPVKNIIMLVLWGWGIFVGLYGAGKIFGNGDGRSIVQRAFQKDESQKVVSYEGTWRKRNYNPQSSDDRVASYTALVKSALRKRRR